MHRTWAVIKHRLVLDQLKGFSGSPRAQSTTNGSLGVPLPGYGLSSVDARRYRVLVSGRD